MRKYINISDVLWFQEGPGVRNTQYTTDGVKLLNVANLINGNVDTTNTNRYISKEEAYGKYKHFLADEGDLVIASSGIKVEYFDKKMGLIRREQLPLCMNTSTIRFKVTDQKRLSIRYFMYYLKSAHFKEQLSQQITGSAQLNFGPSHLKKMVFPLIEMEEQAKIIDKLDTLHDIEYKMRTELKLYDQLTSSLFIEMFGDPVENPMNWDVKELGDYITVLTDFNSNGSYELLDSNVVMKDEPDYAWIVRITDLETMNEKGRKYIDEKTWNLLEKSKICGNEIIMCKIGSAGKIYIMPNTGKPASLGRNAFMFRFNELLEREYVYYLLNTDYGIKEITQYVRGAVTKTITKDDVRRLRVMVPPINEQKKFISFINKIDKSKLAVKKSLEELEILKKSLMQKYFA